jgi:hypothetical protein
MPDKLYSFRWGELAMSHHLPPADALLRFNGFLLQVATHSNRDYYFIFQELPVGDFKARCYLFVKTVSVIRHIKIHRNRGFFGMTWQTETH